MKHVIAFPIIITISLLFLISCSDDFLSPKPLSFLAPENVYLDQAGFEALLVTMRKDLNRETTGNRHYLSAEFVASDLAVAVFQADFRRNTPSDSQFFPFLRFFNDVYSYIKNANVLISRIDQVEWENMSVRNRLLAEAYWHRAYWYYRLVHTYGDVPWVGEEVTGAKLDFQTHSRWAILNKIQEDLEWARDWLPDIPASLGDVTEGAVTHLLAKIYLANLDYDGAIEAASRIINGRYTLMTTRFGIHADDPNRNVQWDLHRWQNRNISQNTETIYTTIDRPEGPPGSWSAGVHSFRLFTPSYWKILDETGNRWCNWTELSGDTLGIGNADVRTNDYWHYRIWEDETYTWQDTPDERRADINWIEIEEIIGCNNGPNHGEPFSKQYYGDLADTTDTWYPWPQYKIFVESENLTQPRGGQADWYIFRLAGTYLLRAEAYYWKGELGSAANDINMVRERAGAPLITAGNVTLDYIFDERARELYMEEPRHSEMVRASYIMAAENREGYNLDNFHENNWFYDRVMKVNHHYHEPRLQWFGNTAWIEPHHVLWAIPQSVIEANTVGRVNQNLGYDGSHNNVPPIETIE